MIEITRMDEDTAHDRTFYVDRPQGHPVYLLLLVKSNAKFYIDDKWLDISPHTAILFRPGQRHLYGPREDAETFPAYIDSWAHIAAPSLALPEHFPYGKPVLLHNPEDYYALFHLIKLEFLGTAPHRAGIIDSLATALLDKISDESNTKEYPDIYYQLVSLREKIYSYPEREWSTKAMAESLHISQGYLHTVYKHFFHITCIHDVIRSRIQAACDLLASTRKPVEEIAELCGYHHTEHFIRQFKQEINMTPGKYRNSLWQAAPEIAVSLGSGSKEFPGQQPPHFLL